MRLALIRGFSRWGGSTGFSLSDYNLAMLEHALGQVLAWIIGRPLSKTDRWARERWRRWRSSAWPITEGGVHSSRVGSKGYGVAAEIAYWYRIQGEYFSGFSQFSFSRENDAWDFVEQHFPAGAPLAIRYHPRRPGKSVLTLHDQQAARMWVGAAPLR